MAYGPDASCRSGKERKKAEKEYLCRCLSLSKADVWPEIQYNIDKKQSNIASIQSNIAIMFINKAKKQLNMASIQ